MLNIYLSLALITVFFLFFLLILFKEINFSKVDDYFLVFDWWGNKDHKTYPDQIIKYLQVCLKLGAFLHIGI